MDMKNIKILTTAAVIGITAVLSACAPSAPAVTTGSQSAAQLNVTAPDDNDPDFTEEEVPYITLPEHTVSAAENQPDKYLGFSGGNDAEAEVLTEEGNTVFLVCVEPGTPREKIDEVIGQYGLSVVYDYENFDIYALAVAEPLNDDGTKQFINELESSYDFIISVEPDGVMTLDGASAQ